MENDFLTSEFCYRTRTSVLQGRQYHIGKGFSDILLLCRFSFCYVAVLGI